MSFLPAWCRKLSGSSEAPHRPQASLSGRSAAAARGSATRPRRRSLSSTLSYYDTLGRTWGGERQLIKVRPVAGDQAARRRVPQGDRAVRLSEVSDRRRDQRDQGDEAADREPDRPSRRIGRPNVKTGMRGHPRRRVHHRFSSSSTAAISPPSASRTRSRPWRPSKNVGCLTLRNIASSTTPTGFCARSEHRLQVLLDSADAPSDAGGRLDELQEAGIRMGYGARSGTEQLDRRRRRSTPAFLCRTTARRRTSTRKILDHLLHADFPRTKQSRQSGSRI